MLNTHFSMYVHTVCIYSLGFGAQVSDLTWVKRNNLNVIWNKLKIHKKTKVDSNLNAHDFENHFNSLMKDEIPLNPDQLKIKTEVQERSLLLSRKYHLPSKSTTHAESYTDRSNVTKVDGSFFFLVRFTPTGAKWRIPATMADNTSRGH